MRRSGTLSDWAYLARAALCAAIIAVLAATPAAAQLRSTTLSVTVTDAQQLPIPGATASLVSADGSTVATALTGVSGVAVLDPVAPGVYALRVELDGFEPLLRKNVLVTEGKSNDVDATLAVPHVAAGVTVVAPGADDASVGTGATRPAATVTRALLQRLPLSVTSIKDALPLVPGVMRSPTGEISLKGATEQRSSLVINGMNAADPGTGDFRLNLPVDSVEAVQVFLHPYTAEYGQFTGGVTTVETRPGGDRWRFELNDFLPDFRFVKGKIKGIAEDSPHLNVSGPLSQRVHFSQSASYTIANRPVRGLTYPDNETRTEGQSYFSQLDVSVLPRHSQRVTVSYAPQRNDFVGLDVFRPRPATPNVEQRDLVVTARDTSQILGGLLTSSVSLSRFDTNVWGQGVEELTLTPTGEQGNYFAAQDRRSRRAELFVVYTSPTLRWLGTTHDIKFGVDLNDVSTHLLYRARPVDIVRGDGTLAEQIAFESASPIDARNREYVGFVQDRWSVRPNLSFDLGLRYEDQRIADAQVVAPRAGFAWGTDSKTTVRGGVGLFYDKVPLNIRNFAKYPARIVTRYGPDGVTVIDRRRFANVLVDAGARAPFPATQADPDAENAFVPGNVSWNLQLDRAVSRWVALRANLIGSRTSNIYIVNPEVNVDGDGAIVLSSTGRSTYRALELTTKIGPSKSSVNVSYIRSHVTGDLNDVNEFFGDVGRPLIRPNQFSQLPTDAPNRFIVWGQVSLPRRVTVAPVFEARTGFPYAVLNAEQNFVGVRNDNLTRFPRFIALDIEVAKEVQVTNKYAVRLSLRGFNVTNHFNPRDVHANVADPSFGRFLASYRRYFAGGFDILF